DAERAEELDQSAQPAELAQARAEELEPERNAYRQPDDPLDAIEPGVEATHEVDKAFHSSMTGTGSSSISHCEEQDSNVEDRPRDLKDDKDPVIDQERMSQEEDRCAEPDEISVNADPGRAALSKQMDDLRHIANKPERNSRKAQELRGVEMHDEAARRRPHHDSFSGSSS